VRVITSIDQISQKEHISWLDSCYSVDVETEGLSYGTDDLLGVALYIANTNESYYLVRKHVLDDGETIQRYLSDADLHLLLSPVMAQTEIVACLHNAKFDLHFFKRFHLPLASHVFDTLLAAQLLDENRSNSLKSLNTLVDIPHEKYHELEEYDHFPKGSPLRVPLQPFAEYAMRDVIITYKLYELFSSALAKESHGGKSLQDVFNSIWMPMVQVLQEMEAHGFVVNVEKAKKLREHYVAEMEKHAEIVQRSGITYLLKKLEASHDIPGYYLKIVKDEDTIYYNESGNAVIDLYGMQTPVIYPTERSKPRHIEFNVGSSKQLSDLVFDDLQLPSHALAMKMTPGGELSADVDNLKMIRHYLGADCPQYIHSLLEWRKAAKLVTTYLDRFVDDSDEEGALHCFFNMAINDNDAGGTATGRLSSSQPNLQQVPSRGQIGDEVRELFEARPGYTLVVADYSNMETVLIAHYSNDPVLKKAFDEGLDVHAVTASTQHNIKYEDFVQRYKDGDAEADAQRRVAKTILFGTAYGMGANKLQRLLLVQNEQEFSLDFVRESLTSFNETYQGVTDFKKEVHKVLRKRGWVRTLRGRVRRLPLAFSQDSYKRSRAERQSVNAIIQGSCAEILFEAMIAIQAVFKSMGGSLVASVHDELIAEVPEQHAELACVIMSTLMVGIVNPELRVKLTAEAHHGKNWLLAKKG
jgi:DNA polymerase I-like protein with 3'-5' exonuclease and polymerase domains